MKESSNEVDLKGEVNNKTVISEKIELIVRAVTVKGDVLTLANDTEAVKEEHDIDLQVEHAVSKVFENSEIPDGVFGDEERKIALEED